MENGSGAEGALAEWIEKGALSMPRTPAKITQADIARTVRGLRAAGVERVRVVFRDDSVIIEADDGQPSAHEERLARRLNVVPL